MPEIIRADSDADFIALLPALVGMRLEQSLALVTFAGSRTINAARLDLPERRDTRTLRSVADACIAIASRTPGADGVALVVVTDSSFEAERGIPWHDLARELDARMGRAGFHVVSLLCTASDGWGRYDARGSDRGPWPLAEITAAGEADRTGLLAADLEAPGAWASLPDEEPALFPMIDLAIDRIVEDWDREAARHPEHHDIVSPAAASSIHREVELALTTAQLHGAAAVGPKHLGMFTAYASAPAWRDTLTLQIAFGRELGEIAAGQQREWTRRRDADGSSMDAVIAAALAAGESVDGGIDELIMGRGGRRPDIDRCRAGVGTLLRAAANVEEPARAGLLCMAGWLCWAIGRASAANLLLREALEIEPGHRMARLVGSLVNAGVVPEWAFAIDADDGEEMP